MLGYFCVSIIHQTLTWTTGSLTCVCDLFACMHTGELGFESHPKDFCVTFAGRSSQPRDKATRKFRPSGSRDAQLSLNSSLHIQHPSFSIALRPQRPYGLLGTVSPGCPLRLSYSSWALTAPCLPRRSYQREEQFFKLRMKVWFTGHDATLALR